MSSGTNDRLAGRLAVTAVWRRSHLLHSAAGLRAAGRLQSVLTQRYVERPGRLAAFCGVVPPPLRRSLEKLTDYHHPDLAGKVCVLAEATREVALYRLAGSRVRRIRRGTFGRAVAEICLEHQAALLTSDTNAVEAMEALHAAGLPTLLDQKIGHRRIARKVLAEELALRGLTHLRQAVIDDYGFSEELTERNDRELAAASTIIAGSQFVRDTLVDCGVDPGRIVVCWYGADVARFATANTGRDPDQPLRLAFVGSAAIRKGLLYLLEAVRSLGTRQIELHVFGHCELPRDLTAGYDAFTTWHGHVSRVRLAGELGRCHAIVLPSLFEGSAYAVHESLAVGLPVVVTPNTGSRVTDGVEGFVVPIRDAAAIARSIDFLFDEPLRRSMSRAAAALAHRCTWKQFGVDLAASLGIAPRIDA